MDLVDAQQARRVLDRMVGYSISPLLWKKVKRGLSAGRVQSVALRIICDREQQINDFIPDEYWSLDALIKPEGAKKAIEAHFYGDKNGKYQLKDREETEKIADEVAKADFIIKEIKNSERQRKAPLPFTTSTLQQEASKALGFSTQKTMRIAQQLYEGVDVKGHGTIGLISYLRTDSTRISEEADAAAREFISENYGSQYTKEAEEGKDKKKAVKIQDAHEAIRPTDAALTPVIVKESITRDQARLYTLIWKRFIASRMKSAVFEVQSAKISAGDYIFTASASKMKFDGFMSVYTDEDNKKETDTLKNNLTKETKLTLEGLDKEQHFTQPPAHFTEASLVKTLEELGIGRPSTYAPTITTILARRYIAKEQKNLFVTELGEAVNKIMNDAFPEIVDVNFTATLEDLLDGVENGTVKWKTVVRNFYPDLKEEVDKAAEELEKVEIHDEVTDEICPNCGRNLVVKYGPHGKFLACPGFPECKFTMPYLEKTGIKCPKCGAEVVIRKTQKGRKFYGCEKYPDCDFTSWQKPSNKRCPKCGNVMVKKRKNLVCIDKECNTIIPIEEGEKDSKE